VHDHHDWISGEKGLIENRGEGFGKREKKSFAVPTRTLFLPDLHTGKTGKRGYTVDLGGQYAEGKKVEVANSEPWGDRSLSGLYRESVCVSVGTGARKTVGRGEAQLTLRASGRVP